MGRAGSSNTFLALEREGEEVPMAPPNKKRGENSLNNGTKLRLSPEDPCRPRARGGTAVQSLRGLRGISSSVSFVYCSS